MDEYATLPNESRYVDIIKSQTYMWKKIFALSTDEADFKKPLTHKILSNPDSKFVKALIYLYSMESFIYSELNRASR